MRALRTACKARLGRSCGWGRARATHVGKTAGDGGEQRAQDQQQLAAAGPWVVMPTAARPARVTAEACKSTPFTPPNPVERLLDESVGVTPPITNIED